MKRRTLLTHATVAVASTCLPSLASAREIGKVQSLSQVLLWLDALEAAPGVKTSGAWPLSSVMEHLSQSIEMSMDGFPEPKSVLFQSTLGAAAFAVFKWRGQMSHSLSEAIPGAPVLIPTQAWRPAVTRLRVGIARFSAYNGLLKPHFAYGNLIKSDYIVAHVMHVANHQGEVEIHRLA